MPAARFHTRRERGQSGARFFFIAAAVLALGPPQAAAQTGDGALAAVRQNRRLANSDALLVMRDRRVLINDHADIAAAAAADAMIDLMSATKGIVALAVMKLISDGSIANLDEPVHTWFPQWRQGRKQEIPSQSELRMALHERLGPEGYRARQSPMLNDPYTVRFPPITGRRATRPIASVPAPLWSRLERSATTRLQ